MGFINKHYDYFANSRGKKSVGSMMSTTCGIDMDNYPRKFCNDYYCIYCDKTLSRNVKHIDDQNKSKSHIKFIKLQDNTQALKCMFIGMSKVS
jgi:wyosine [tRNA(Phe)-imidazoG37] synthetase (radical SAM superfamily)